MTTKSEYAKKTLAELQETLTNAVNSLETPEGWTKWLTVAASLPKYSLRNQLVLLEQAQALNVKPRAFASYNAWKKAGHTVNKGEKAFRIFAPVTKKVPFDKESGKTVADPDEVNPVNLGYTSKVVGFKAVPTFEVSQTSADTVVEIPDELKPDAITDFAPDDLIENLLSVANSNGTPVEFKPDSEMSVDGYFSYNAYDPTDRQICIKESLSKADTAATLVHEVAHMLMHIKSDKPRPTKEIEAESVAYIVSARLGFDISPRSIKYVAGWAGFNAENVEVTARTVIDVSGELLEQLESVVSLPVAA